jgi:hypothetical protein
VSEFGKAIAEAYAVDGAAITTGGTDVLGDFLRSREGQAFGRKVARGVFGMLRKRL